MWGQRSSHWRTVVLKKGCRALCIAYYIRKYSVTAFFTFHDLCIWVLWSAPSGDHQYQVFWLHRQTTVLWQVYTQVQHTMYAYVWPHSQYTCALSQRQRITEYRSLTGQGVFSSGEPSSVSFRLIVGLSTAACTKRAAWKCGTFTMQLNQGSKHPQKYTAHWLTKKIRLDLKILSQLRVSSRWLKSLILRSSPTFMLNIFVCACVCSHSHKCTMICPLCFFALCTPNPSNSCSQCLSCS